MSSKKGTQKSSSKNVSLERTPGMGMNPIQILTGFYGARGERLKHTVNDGALKMPREAMELMDEVIQENDLEIHDKYKLPKLGEVVRPSADPNMETLIVTHVKLVEEMVPDPAQPPLEAAPGFPAPEPKMTSVIKTKIENKITERNQTVDSERIRGGGGADEDEMDVDPEPTTSASATNTHQTFLPGAAQNESESVPIVAGDEAHVAPPASAPSSGGNSDAAVVVQPTDAPSKAPPQDVIAKAEASNNDRPVETVRSETGKAAPASAMSNTPVPPSAPASTEATAAAMSPSKESSETPATSKSEPAMVSEPVKVTTTAAQSPVAAMLTNVSAGPVLEKASTTSSQHYPPSAVGTLPAPVTISAAAPVPMPPPSVQRPPSSGMNAGAPRTNAAPAPVAANVPLATAPTPVGTNNQTNSQPPPRADAAPSQATDAAPVPAPVPAPATEVSETPPSNATTTQANTTSTAAIPSAAPSSDASKAERKASPNNVKYRSLDVKPEARWELYRPASNDEMVTPKDQFTPKPTWYRPDAVADVERTMLPEWFDGSAPHRTPESYIKARETILKISETIANRNITCSMVRRSIPGDAGSLLRLRNFMTCWSLINEDAINDSAPTPAVLREAPPQPKSLSAKQRECLIEAVVSQAAKRRKLDENGSGLIIDWDLVALQVGDGASPSDCELNFLTMPIGQENEETSERPTTQDAEGEADFKAFPRKEELQRQFLQEIVEKSDPEVVLKATEAALQATSDIEKARSSAILGLISSQATEDAKRAEDELQSVLSEILDQRMKRLENRMTMMDDVEAILEAERVALEMERRDLYTARCRHWYSGA